MNQIKTRKRALRSIRFYRPVLLLLSFLMLQGCALSVQIPSTESDTSTAETLRDTIYFWWKSKGKSELWRHESEGVSQILYSVTTEHTLGEVMESGLLSEENAQIIKELFADKVQEKGADLSIEIYPRSLSLSPDKKRLAWVESVHHCEWISDVSDCFGEIVIRIFNLEENRLEITLNTKSYSGRTQNPLWSPDSQHIVISLGQDASVQILDIKTLSFERVGQGTTFCWDRHGNKLIYANRNGVQSYDLSIRQSTPILANQGNYLRLAVSPNDENLVYTFFSDDNVNDVMFMVDLKTGENNPIIEQNNGRWLYDIGWRSDNQIVYSQQLSDTAPDHLYIRDTTTGEIVLDEVVPLEISPRSYGELSTDRTKILYVGYKYSEAIILMVFDFITKEWSFVPLPQKLQEIISSAATADPLWQQHLIENATW